MAGSIVRKMINKNYEIIGVFSSAANYLADLNKSSAEEGMTYYDTTLNQLRTYDGSSWSPAGMSSTSAGSLNDACSIGGTITVDGSTVSTDFAVTVSDGGDDVCATFTQNDVTNNGKGVLLVNTGSGVTLDFTSSGTYDIQGTSDTWDISAAGAAHFTAVAVDDDEDIELGAATNGDVRFLFHEGAAGTAGNSLLLDALGEDEQLQIGDATYSFDVWFVGDTATTNFMKWDLNGGADSVGALVFDNADIDLGDNDILRFGDVQDVYMRWDNTNFDVLAAAATDFIFGTTTTNINVVINGDFRLDGLSAGVDIQWDRSEDTLEILDDAFVAFGDGDDVTLQWDQTNFEMFAAAADTPWAIGGTAAGFDITYYHEGSGTIFVDYDGLKTYFDGCDLWLKDNDFLLFGDSATDTSTNPDASISWTGSTGQLDIAGTCAFAGAVTVACLTVTGAFSHTGAYSPTALSLDDDEEFTFGTGDDYTMSTAGSTAHLIIKCATANDGVTFGDGTVACDVKFDNITTAGADFHWDQSADSAAGTLYFGKDDKGFDVLFYGDTAGDFIQFDMTQDRLIFEDCSCTFMDDTKLNFGDGSTNAGDFYVTSDGANLFIKEVSAAGKGLEIGENNKGIDVKFFGETASAYMEWTQATDELIFEGADLHIKDDDILNFGDGKDVSVTWDGTNLAVEAVADNTGQIQVGATNAIDLLYYDSSAGKTVLFDVDTAIIEINDWDVNLQDDDFLYFGDSNDISINWDGTQLSVDGAAEGTVIRIGAANSQNLLIYGDNTNDTVEWDSTGEDVRFNGWDLSIMDTDILNFGDGDDITITWDKTDLHIDAAAADSKIQLGYTNNIDLIISGDNTNQTITFDTSAEDMQFNGFDLTLQDDDILNFGDADDIFMAWDATTFKIDGIAASTPFHLGDASTGFDLTYYFETAGTIFFDYDGDDLQFSDNMSLAFGSSDDITIVWDKTDLLIDGAGEGTVIKIGATNSQNIVIYGDNTNTTVEWDSTGEDVRFNGWDLSLQDADILNFGDGDDITITWDATQLNIDGAAANKAIRIGFTNNQDINIYGDNTNDTVIFDTSAEMCTFNGFDLTMNDADIIKFGDSGAESTIASDGTNTNWTVSSGAVDIGDGGTTNYASFSTTGNLTLTGSAQLTSFRRKVTAKVGDYTLTTADSGGVFTNYGAGVGVNFTLPAKATGLNYTIIVAADQTVTVTSDAADTMVCFNDAACDTVAYSTAGDLLGGAFYVITDGNLWYVLPMHYGEGVNTQTITQTT